MILATRLMLKAQLSTRQKCQNTTPGTPKVRGMVNKRIGLIGDVHAEDKRLQAAISYLQLADVDSLICTGDIVDGNGDPDACIRILEDNDVHVVQGNHD